MSYSVQNIRNVCLVGHSGNGKTALAESLLFMTGAINRMGNSADGNTVCDYDPEEIRRQISISTAVAPLEYKGCKINLLDTPGAFDFSGEVMEALRAADAAILVCSAKDGISVGFEKVWKYCQERDMPRFIYISKTDEENSDYNATFNALRERYGNKIAPLVVPMWDADKKTTGLIDVLNKRAYEMQDFKRVEVDIPPEKADVVAEFNEALKESVAETSDEMVDKYFSGESFTYAEMIQGLRQGVRELSMFPVLFGSAINCIGSLMLMDYIVDLLPNPMEGNHHKAIREILFSLVASDGKTPEGSRHMRADDLLEILKPVSAQIDEERLPALGRLFQDLADGFFDEPSRAPYLSRGAGRALTDRTETGELRWLRLGRQSGRRLLRELYSRCAPRSVWDVFHRWQGEVYYTVLRRPLSQDLPRGVYLLSRFEDQTGLDVTGLFWLENVTVGVAHLCKGEFFEELLDLLLSRPTREAALPAARPREETMVSGYSYLLQEAFEQYGRGMG